MTHLKNHLASAILAVLLLISAHALAQPAVRLTSASGHPILIPSAAALFASFEVRQPLNESIATTTFMLQIYAKYLE